ncbi:unnamed protein product [Gadus morhua 'NCC']
MQASGGDWRWRVAVEVAVAVAVEVEVAVVVAVVEVVVEFVEVVVVVELVVELVVVLEFFPGCLLRVYLFSWQKARFIPMADGYTRLPPRAAGYQSGPPCGSTMGLASVQPEQTPLNVHMGLNPTGRAGQTEAVYSNMICSNGQDVTIAMTPCLDV